MRWGRLRYLLPVVVTLATGLLAGLCLVRGIDDAKRLVPGFFFHASGAVASMQRGGWEGLRAGIRPGDAVLSVDGRPVSSGMALARMLKKRRPGQRVRLGMVRPSTGERWEATLPLRRLTTFDILATFVLPFCIGVIYLLLGAVIFFVKRTYEAALAMAICVVASVFYMALFNVHTSYTFHRLWAIYPLMGAISVHLFAAFPARRPGVHRPLFLALLYILTAGILAFVEAALLRPDLWGLSSTLSASFLALCFVSDFVLLTLTRTREPSESIRNKAKTIQVGLVVAVAAAVIWSLMVRHFPQFITAERAMMLSALFPALFAYALVKKNLFDMDIFLRTTTIYVIATALVLVLYFSVVFILGVAMSVWTRRYAGLGQNLEVAVISTLVVVLLFHPLRLGVQKLVDRLFFREKGILEETLSTLGRELAAQTQDLQGLSRRFTEQLRELFRWRFAVLICPSPSRGDLEVTGMAGQASEDLAALSLPTDSPWVRRLQGLDGVVTDWRRLAGIWPDELREILEQNQVSTIVSLRTASSLAGVLLLGPRQHGDVLTPFELGALRSLASTVALLLENSLLLHKHAEKERLAALGQLSAVIIHEIKNPLGIIRVSSGTLKKRFSPSDSGYELASFIEEEVVRMNSTIAQFLTFTRPRSPSIETFDLAELVARTAAAFEEEMREVGILVQTDLVSSMPVRGDADQVQQVLLNLLVNARQALAGRERGSIRIVVRPEPPGSPYSRAELVVTDDGPGIDPALADRVFEPFFSTRRGGTGLGLAIARQLLEEQGGRISVRRSGGGGAEVVVTLLREDVRL